MKNLSRLYSETLSEALSVGLDVSDKIVSIKVNSRLSRALGRCVQVWDAWNRCYVYKIEIQPNILADGLEDSIPKNTIMHELIHTCKGCFNHGDEFQYRAGIVNRRLSYNVHTTTDSASLVAAGVTLKQHTDNYAVVCDKCGRTVKKYKRWSSTLERIGDFRHGGTCGGNLHVVSLNPSIAIASARWEGK